MSRPSAEAALVWSGGLGDAGESFGDVEGAFGEETGSVFGGLTGPGEVGPTGCARPEPAPGVCFEPPPPAGPDVVVYASARMIGVTCFPEARLTASTS